MSDSTGVASASSANSLAQRHVIVHDFTEWRETARALIAQGVAPAQVSWRDQFAPDDLFAPHDLFAPAVALRTATTDAIPYDLHDGQPRHDLHLASDAQGALAPAAASAKPANTANTTNASNAATNALRIPRAMMLTLASAACHADIDRWAFLYQVVWRWQQGDRAVLSPADSDGARLAAMVKAVRHEEHDMHAYLRFRERPIEAGAPRFVAWFEPIHDILPQVAQHFAKRMGRISWMIATPRATVMWDGLTVHTTAALLRGPADIDDAGEALWLTYYRSIFNPARLNADLMHSHIPSRFWKNLPEGSVVPTMVANAAAGARRVGQVDRVGQRDGSVIAISAERAQPQRALATTLSQCRRCPLWEHATQAVAGVGPRDAHIMLVGEQPGDREDLAGVPFIGPAGQLLDTILQRAQLPRDSVYLTNAVKHFKWEPRGKRRIHKTPAQREIAACADWLEQELADVKPQVVVTLGSTALKAVTGDSRAALADHLGKPIKQDGRWVVAIYHPSYVLRVQSDDEKARAIEVMIDGLRAAQRLCT